MLSFTSNESEFLAENEFVEIDPSFTYRSTIQFLDVTCGPFRPNLTTRVPLWLAIQLRSMKRCKIKPPAWMEVEALERHLEAEIRETRVFIPIAYHYVEISRLLLHHARDDIAQPNRVTELLSDIHDARDAKLRRGLAQIQVGGGSVRMNNISAMELSTHRLFILEAIRRFHALEQAAEAIGTSHNALRATASQQAAAMAAANAPPPSVVASYAANSQQQQQLSQASSSASNDDAFDASQPSTNTSSSSAFSRRPRAQASSSQHAHDDPQAPSAPQRSLRRFR